MRNLVWIPVFIIFAILQSTALNYMKIGGVKPDILLLAVAFYALSCGVPEFGLGIGVLGGLLRDLSSGGTFAVGALCFSILGMIFGCLGRRVYIESFFIQFLVSFGAAVFTSILYYLISTIFRNMPPLWGSLRFAILPASVYTALISPIVFRVLKSIGYSS